MKMSCHCILWYNKCCSSNAFVLNGSPLIHYFYWINLKKSIQRISFSLHNDSLPLLYVTQLLIPIFFVGTIEMMYPLLLKISRKNGKSKTLLSYQEISSLLFWHWFCIFNWKRIKSSKIQSATVNPDRFWNNFISSFQVSFQLNSNFFFISSYSRVLEMRKFLFGVKKKIISARTIWL